MLSYVEFGYDWSLPEPLSEDFDEKCDKFEAMYEDHLRRLYEIFTNPYFRYSFNADAENGPFVDVCTHSIKDPNTIQCSHFIRIKPGIEAQNHDEYSIESFEKFTEDYCRNPYTEDKLYVYYSK